MTSGNPTLDKNLECIGVYNPILKDKLLNLPYLTNTIELIETELKEPNLSYNGLPLHSQSGAESEAKDLFDRAEDEFNCINLILGMGLGHLFKEFCERTVGGVLLYEENLEILRVTLELVDFSKELSQKNVKVASDFQELKDGIGPLYKYKSEVNFLYLNSYTHIYGEDAIQHILNQVQMVKGTYSEQYTMVKAKGLEFVSSTLSNLAYSLEATPLKEFKDVYYGKTAVIISAGPSLDTSIESIKKNRDKIVIFCVGTAFKSLVANGITPDFVNIIEMFDCSGQLKGYDLSNINLILEPFVNESFHKLKVKKKLLYPSITTTGAQYWSRITNIDISEYISGGTVSYEALESAKMLGFKKLILVGQDLAFANNQCYSNKGAYSDLIFETNTETGQLEFKVKDWDKFIESCSSADESMTTEEVEEFAKSKVDIYKKTSCFVKGVNGEMIPSHAAYALFIDLFREFAYRSKGKGLELINTSMVGAQIDGFENMTLEQALENIEPLEKIEFASDFQYDKEVILNKLDKEVGFLNEILELFKKPNEYFYKFERDYNRNQEVTATSYKYINLILEVYDYLTIKYFNNNLLYRVLSINESLELKYYADRKKEDDEIKLKNLFNFLKIYFVMVEQRVLKIIDEINVQIEILRNDINSNKAECLKT